MKKLDKPKIAIFDFTDCEGCEVEFINLEEKLMALLDGVEIADWRLAKKNADPGPFDISIIEGAPVTPHEQNLLRKIREDSKYLIALGACACTGGIPAIIDDEHDRARFYKEVYPPEYKPEGTEAKPLDHYVKVDLKINGCPVDKDEIERCLSDLLLGKIPEDRDFPVCLECKHWDNKCNLTEDKPCLGPITRGGCGAFCIRFAKTCVGCYGLVTDANFSAMVERLNEIQPAEATEKMLNMFLSENEEFKKYYGKI